MRSLFVAHRWQELLLFDILRLPDSSVSCELPYICIDAITYVLGFNNTSFPFITFINYESTILYERIFVIVYSRSALWRLNMVSLMVKRGQKHFLVASYSHLYIVLTRYVNNHWGICYTDNTLTTLRTQVGTLWVRFGRNTRCMK